MAKLAVTTQDQSDLWLWIVHKKLWEPSTSVIHNASSCCTTNALPRQCKEQLVKFCLKEMPCLLELNEQTHCVGQHDVYRAPYSTCTGIRSTSSGLCSRTSVVCNTPLRKHRRPSTKLFVRSLLNHTQYSDMFRLLSIQPPTGFSQ